MKLWMINQCMKDHDQNRARSAFFVVIFQKGVESKIVLKCQLALTTTETAKVPLTSAQKNECDSLIFLKCKLMFCRFLQLDLFLKSRRCCTLEFKSSSFMTAYGNLITTGSNHDFKRPQHGSCHGMVHKEYISSSIKQYQPAKLWNCGFYLIYIYNPQM